MITRDEKAPITQNLTKALKPDTVNAMCVECKKEIIEALKLVYAGKRKLELLIK